MTTNKHYHVLKRLIGDYTHYSELPICFEGTYKDCKIHLETLGFYHIEDITDNDELVLYCIYGNATCDYEYLLAS